MFAQEDTLLRTAARIDAALALCRPQSIQTSGKGKSAGKSVTFKGGAGLHLSEAARNRLFAFNVAMALLCVMLISWLMSRYREVCVRFFWVSIELCEFHF